MPTARPKSTDRTTEPHRELSPEVDANYRPNTEYSSGSTPNRLSLPVGVSTPAQYSTTPRSTSYPTMTNITNKSDTFSSARSVPASPRIPRVQEYTGSGTRLRSGRISRQPDRFHY